MTCTIEHILQCNPSDVFPHVIMLLFTIGCFVALAGLSRPK